MSGTSVRLHAKIRRSFMWKAIGYRKRTWTFSTYKQLWGI